MNELPTDELKSLFQPQRMEGESYENYRTRRSVEAKVAKLMRQGNVLWDSKTQKTFRKSKEN